MFRLQNRLNMLLEGTDIQAIKDIASDSINKLKTAHVNPSGLHQFENFIATLTIEELNKIEESDSSVLQFIERESQISKIENLGVKEAFAKISESSISNYPEVKLMIENVRPHIGRPEYMIAENFRGLLKPFEWDDTVKEIIESLNTSISEQRENIKLQLAIDTLVESSSAYLIKGFESQLDSYYTNRDNASRTVLLEKLNAYSFDMNVKNLINAVNESSKSFKLANASGHVNISHIFSPAIFERNHTIFSLGTKYIKKEGDVLTTLTEAEVKAIPEWFVRASQFINNPEVKTLPNSIETYAGEKKVQLSENKDGNVEIHINEKLVTAENFNKVFMATGIFHRRELAQMNEIHNIITNFKNIVQIDFAKRIEDARVEGKYVDVMSTNEGIYISQVDKKSLLDTFTPINAFAARERVLEFLNYDLAETFREVLDVDDQKIAEIEDTKIKIEEGLSLLKQKKNQIVLMMESDETLDEGGEMTELINIINEEVDRLQSDLSKSNSNIAKIKQGDVNESEIQVGTKVQVGDKLGTVESFANDTYKILIDNSDDVIDAVMDDIKILEKKTLNEADCKFKVNDKIMVADGRTGKITGIDLPSRIVNALMDDGRTVEIPVERAAEIKIINTSSTAEVGAEDPDGVQRLNDVEKTAVLEAMIDGKLLKTGEDIEIDALEYTSKGDKDKITVILKGKKQKIAKALISIND